MSCTARPKFRFAKRLEFNPEAADHDDERVRELDTIAAEVAEWEASLPDDPSEALGSDAP